MTPEIKRLFEEFNAQDCCSSALAKIAGRDTVVALWNEGNQMWVITPAGTALLAQNDAVESVNALASDDKPKRTRKAKVEAVVDELNLDDI